MVGIAQLAERLVVVQEVAGSIPVTHPNEARRRRSSAIAVLGKAGRDVKSRMLELDAFAFERLVVDELDLLPDDIVDGLDNVIFVVEDRTEDGTLDILGLYDGVALTERGQYGFGEMPDRIVLYREPLLAICDTLDDLHVEIHITLVHEIAHFFGLDDDRLHELGWG